jgi:N-acetyl-gamma-glutamylphosphate reductase
VARVAVLGASGYSGHEFVRLALTHPGLEIAALVSREYAGRPAGELLPGVDARVTHLPSPVAPDALRELLAQGAFDTLVTCLPHGA